MKKEGLRDKLFNNDIDIRQRLFVLNVLVTEIILFVDLVEVIFLDEILYDKLLLLFAMIAICLVCVITVKKNVVGFGAAFICFGLGFIFIPISFINGGGINGDCPIWFVYIILMISILLTGKTRIAFLIGELLIGTACYYIDLFHPELIVPTSREWGVVFSYISLVMIGIATSIMVTLEITLFTKEKKRTEE
ncbi:MAG: hypothetical protein J5515_06885, partial [Lachnospiraceae bacterium]|nr:hypothetical protein [Lachnospiraceae bacterium]